MNKLNELEEKHQRKHQRLIKELDECEKEINEELKRSGISALSIDGSFRSRPICGICSTENHLLVMDLSDDGKQYVCYACGYHFDKEKWASNSSQ